MRVFYLGRSEVSWLATMDLWPGLPLLKHGSINRIAACIFFLFKTNSFISFSPSPCKLFVNEGLKLIQS